MHLCAVAVAFLTSDVIFFLVDKQPFALLAPKRKEERQQQIGLTFSTSKLSFFIFIFFSSFLVLFYGSPSSCGNDTHSRHSISKNVKNNQRNEHSLWFETTIFTSRRRKWNEIRKRTNKMWHNRFGLSVGTVDCAISSTSEWQRNKRREYCLSQVTWMKLNGKKSFVSVFFSDNKNERKENILSFEILIHWISRLFSSIRFCFGRLSIVYVFLFV